MFININNELVNDDVVSFLNALKNSDKEGLVKNYNKGFVIKYSDYILVSILNPYKVYKNSFNIEKKNKLKKLNGTYFTLACKFDLVITDEEICFLTNKGERLFNLEKSYKNICKKKLEIIDKYSIVDDIEYLKKTSLKEQNLKKYFDFNEDNINIVSKNSKNLVKIAKYLNIKTTADKKNLLYQIMKNRQIISLNSFAIKLHAIY